MMKKIVFFWGAMFFASFLHAQVVDSGDKVGIGTTLPLEKFQIGDKWTFHNGGHKVIGYNTYYSNGHKRIFEDEVSLLRFDSDGNIRFQSAPSGGIGINISVADNLIIRNNGNVGIGTENPSGRLHIQTDSRNPVIIDNSGTGTVYGYTSFIGFNSKLVNGVVTEVNASSKNAGALIDAFSYESGIGSSFLRFRVFDDNMNENGLMVIKNGNVGIGTDNPKTKLSVEGTIISSEIIVLTDISKYPDFVFSDNYKLRSLKELEKYIEENNHLPDIPKTNEVIDGIVLGEMNIKLLQKVEELTLYTIEQQKQIDKQMKLIEKLEKMIAKLEK